MAMIRLNNITKKYGEKLIFENFSLDIEEKKCTVILGESGSGKTTLFNILMGLTNYEGEIINKPKTFSAVFQKNVLVPSLSVSENIKLVNPNANVKRLLSLVGLEKNENDYIKSLSAGMLRRVAILRALSLNADALLMDEPFINLDLSLKNHLNGVIKGEINKNGQTLIMITHDVKEAVLMADNVVIISDGKIKYQSKNKGERTEKEIYEIMTNLKKY